MNFFAVKRYFIPDFDKKPLLGAYTVIIVQLRGIDCYIKNNNQLDLLFGVFDGHGGQEVAIFCKAVFPTVLEWNM